MCEGVYCEVVCVRVYVRVYGCVKVYVRTVCVCEGV